MSFTDKLEGQFPSSPASETNPQIHSLYENSCQIRVAAAFYLL